MADKEKTTSTQSKNYPKDGQVIISIMKEMGIKDFEPKTIVQLTEFVYRFATSILEEAQMYANVASSSKNNANNAKNNANLTKKRSLGADDVRLALQLTTESSFSTPPPREAILECASVKNYMPLPMVKVHCGLRLPPDRHCLSSCNYVLKSSSQKKGKASYASNAGAAIKISAKPNANYIKRSPMVAKQTVTIPKPLTKITTGSPMQKTMLKPKIQITQNIQVAGTAMGDSLMDVDSLKRKREADDM